MGRLRLSILWLAMLFLLLVVSIYKAEAKIASVDLHKAQWAQIKNFFAAYNHIETMIGKFTQQDYAGKASTGLFYISKPGKMRFIYQGEYRKDIISDGKTVVVIDNELESRNTFTLKEIPLSILLRKKISLDDFSSIMGFQDSGKNNRLLLGLNIAKQTYRLLLIFNKKNYQLVQWVFTSPDSRRTIFNINSVKTNVNIADAYFMLPDVRDRSINR